MQQNFCFARRKTSPTFCSKAIRCVAEGRFVKYIICRCEVQEQLHSFSVWNWYPSVQLTGTAIADCSLSNALLLSQAGICLGQQIRSEGPITGGKALKHRPSFPVVQSPDIRMTPKPTVSMLSCDWHLLSSFLFLLGRKGQFPAIVVRRKSRRCCMMSS